MTQPDDAGSAARKRKVRTFGFVVLALVVASLTFRVLIGMASDTRRWFSSAFRDPRLAHRFGGTTGDCDRSVMRTTTLALLVAWIFLAKGSLWLMAAPIVYLVGWFVGG